MEIILSCSDKSSPWQNGYKERFYDTLKDELGFKDLVELHEGIALTIYYYNHRRTHTAMKMSPVAYATRLSLEGQLKDYLKRTGCLLFGEVYNPACSHTRTALSEELERIIFIDHLYLTFV